MYVHVYIHFFQKSIIPLLIKKFAISKITSLCKAEYHQSYINITLQTSCFKTNFYDTSTDTQLANFLYKD